jgi:hypothetical protein
MLDSFILAGVLPASAILLTLSVVYTRKAQKCARRAEFAASNARADRADAMKAKLHSQWSAQSADRSAARAESLATGLDLDPAIVPFPELSMHAEVTTDLAAQFEPLFQDTGDPIA